MQTITPHIMTSWSEIEKLKEDWNPLLQQSDADNIFLTWQWIESWKKTCSPNTKPFFVVLKQAQQVVAIAPFYIQPYRLFKFFTYQVLRFAGDQGIGSEYSNFIVKQEQTIELKTLLWSTLLTSDQASHWDLIWYSNVAKWSKGGETLLTSLQKTPQLNMKSRVVEFANTELKNVSEQILPSLSKSLRTNIKQTQNYLSRQGDWQVSFCDDPSQLEKELNQLFELHNLRWQNVGLQGSFEVMKSIIDAFELNIFPLAKINCEPNLGKRNLYPTISRKGIYSKEIKLRSNLIAFANGKKNIFEISNLLNINLKEVCKEYKLLKKNNIL